MSSRKRHRGPGGGPRGGPASERDEDSLPLADDEAQHLARALAVVVPTKLRYSRRRERWWRSQHPEITDVEVACYVAAVDRALRRAS